MQFWIVGGVLAVVCLLVVFLPLLRGFGRASRRASYDMQVYRDQLREVETELARGVLTPEEAEATRAEVSRRLLAAADAEGAEAETHTAPRRVSRIAGALLLIAVAGLALGIYDRVGVPGYPDLPLALREQRMAEARASRPSQEEAEAAIAANADAAQRPQLRPEDAALVEKLRAVLKDRPGDLEGHRLLARSLGSMGQFPEARAAQEAVIAMQNGNATVNDELQLAELMILATNGYVSPQAEAVIAKVLARDPQNPVARYYSGLTLLQGGRPDLAYPLWARLLEEGPPDAPWIAPIRNDIAEVARLAGMPPPEGVATPAPGPNQADITAAEQMTPEERQAMITGMVDQLNERLATEGGPPADWARLIRALGVLGRTDQAKETWEEAQTKFAGNGAALAEINAAAQAGGLTQ
ncbi:c-type cytochrome biogenesis protein CcmI [Rhodobacteraceae bacterium DSL-40]|uniref:c-type cytochrome biogenesis protein CcmI n=1 Tax=Amaricoccus sp. B4 TaxID=3368557 RepID=UPI000DADC4D3